MGRRKIISDDAVLEALLKVVERSGPGELTFSKASATVGLSSATLVQRFGTREAMVEAVLMHAWDRLDALTIALDNEEPLTPRGAVSLLLRLMPGSAAHYNVTEGLLLLREDLVNPSLRARGCAWGDYLAKALGKRLAPGAKRGALMGWQMLSLWQGVMIWWAFKRDIDPERAIRAALERWCQSVGLDVRTRSHLPRRRSSAS